MLSIPALLSLLFAIAVIGGLVVKVLRLPLILGYLLAGVFLSTIGIVQNVETKHFLETFGHLGVTLLLFLIGLEFPISQLRQIGKVMVIVGVLQVLISTVLGWVALQIMGVHAMTALFVAPALAFSSTIVVVKILSEKRDLSSLSGRLSLGLLLIQDFMAMVILTLVSAGGASSNIDTLVLLLIKATVLVGVTIFVSVVIGPKLLPQFSTTPELLYVGALAWCLLISGFVSSSVVGFSSEIGGFLAGLAFAGASEHLQIASRLKPLRDFFLVVFFVWLGSQIQLFQLFQHLPLALVLTMFVVVVNPLLVTTLLILAGYKKRTAFLSGLAMGQLSEFSLILLTALSSSQLIESSLLPVFTLTAMFSMALSGFVLFRSETLYRVVFSKLQVFDLLQRKSKPHAFTQSRKGHILLFGYDRTGSRLLPILEKMGLPIVVVDFNPNQIQPLLNKDMDAVYGDMGDVELYEELGVLEAKVIVSTVTDVHDNLQLLHYLAIHPRHKPVVLLTAANTLDANSLYNKGATFVLVPHLVGGDYLGHVLEKKGIDVKNWNQAYTP